MLKFQVRNNLRRYFITSKVRKLGYDIITWIVTQLAISYTIAPFFILAVAPSLKMYKYVSMLIHWYCLVQNDLSLCVKLLLIIK